MMSSEQHFDATVKASSSDGRNGGVLAGCKMRKPTQTQTAAADFHRIQSQASEWPTVELRSTPTNEQAREADASEQPARLEPAGSRQEHEGATSSTTMGQQLVRPESSRQPVKANSGSRKRPAGNNNNNNQQQQRQVSAIIRKPMKSRQATSESISSGSVQQQRQLREDKQQHLRHANSELSSGNQALVSGCPNVQQQQDNNSTATLCLVNRQQPKERHQHDLLSMRSQSALGGTVESGGTMAPETNRARTARDCSTIVRPNKITRVRINSTSEQIQDPNWLIRMSKESERHKKSHLKSLHRKLKSTITGGQSSGNREPELRCNSSQDSSNQSTEPPPLMPSTPVKMPVSILKQRTTNNQAQSGPNKPTLNIQQQQQQHRSKSPVLPAAQSTPQIPPIKGSNSRAAKRHSPAAVTPLQNPTNQTTTTNPSNETTQTNQTTGRSSATGPVSPQVPPPPPPPIVVEAKPVAKHVPICADGQVKVSGWKRNNLLAKTLSHFDEIRGNQRPVFMPTKIRLPPTTTSDKTAAGTQAANSSSASGNKFADIVREAITKKSLLASSGGGNALESPSAPSDSVDRRSSQGSPFKEQQQQQHSIRPVSADPAQYYAQQQSQLNPHRSSSASITSQTAPGTGNSSNNSPASTVNKQQVIMHAMNQRKRNSDNLVSHSSLATPNLMSQLLSSAQQSSHQFLEASSSSRQFKLQQKNIQVLQNLRRQSNELQATLQHAAHDGCSTAATAGSSPLGSRGGSMHIKDWKRLTNKLALLTGGNRTQQQQQQQPNQHSPMMTLLMVNDDEPSHDSSSGGNKQLRLTVSNQEASSRSSGHSETLEQAKGKFMQRGGSNSQQQLVSSTAGLQVPGAAQPASSVSERKLSSSSMVVQPVTTTGDDSRSPPSSSPIGTNESGNQTVMRRSSDSEAITCASKENFDEPEITCSSNQTTANKPVVVCRDDLLQLLQVATNSNGSAQQQDHLRLSNKSSRDSSSVSPERGERHSLQLTTHGSSSSSGDDQTALLQNQADRAKIREDKSNKLSRSNSLKTDRDKSYLLRMTAEQLRGSSRDDNEIPARQKQQQRPMEPAECSPTSEGVDEGTEQPPKQRKADFSWVVKKTSKVALIQQRLRKMRWTTKQRKKCQQQAEVAGQENLLATVTGGGKQPASGYAGDRSPEVDGGSENSELHNKMPTSKANVYCGDSAATPGNPTASSPIGSDVFMDPTLIGDAIEIFLRSTMQNKSAVDASGVVAVVESLEGANGDDDDDEQLDDGEKTAGGELSEESSPPPPIGRRQGDETAQGAQLMSLDGAGIQSAPQPPTGAAASAAGSTTAAQA